MGTPTSELHLLLPPPLGSCIAQALNDSCMVNACTSCRWQESSLPGAGESSSIDALIKLLEMVMCRPPGETSCLDMDLVVGPTYKLPRKARAKHDLHSLAVLTCRWGMTKQQHRGALGS